MAGERKKPTKKTSGKTARVKKAKTASSPKPTAKRQATTAKTRAKKTTSKAKIVTAAILVIGDEILSGRTKDLNIGYMADHFTAIGIDLKEVRIVADIQEDIVAAVNALRARYTYLFTTGGIGPTHDDITADAIAKAFNVPIDFDDRATAILEAYYADGEFTDARRRMTRIPQGADLIENQVSKAPGFWIENVLVMAGVPTIMQSMLDAVTPKLKTGRKMHSSTIHIGQAESTIAKLLADYQEAFADVSMGSYPFYNKGVFNTHIVMRSLEVRQLKKAVTGITKLLKKEGVKEVSLVDTGGNNQ